MMKKWLPLTLAALNMLALGAAEMRPVSWSDSTNAASRFQTNTSGKMIIADDPAQKAVRFDVEFKPGTDFWVYPALQLYDNESLADVKQIRFDFKAMQGNPDAKYTCAYVMFDGEKQYFTLPTPKNEYQTVTIDVPQAVKNPGAARNIKIGMNPQDTKLTYFVRNIQFLTDDANDAAAADELAWSAATNSAKRFAANTSGKMTIDDDADQKAVRFEVEFKPDTDRWAYPVMQFLPGESLADVGQIRFDFKAVQGNPDAKYTSAYVMFGNEKPYYALPVPKSEYQTVVINVAKAVKDPAAVKNIKIGMNPKDTKLTFFIRNLQFIGKAK